LRSTASARKCRFCGEFLDGKSGASAGISRYAKQESEKTTRRSLAPPTVQYHRGIAGVLSFLLPGAGQIYKTEVGKGIAVFLGVPLCYAIGLLMLNATTLIGGLVLLCGAGLHLFAIVDAVDSENADVARTDVRRRPDVRAERPDRLFPKRALRQPDWLPTPCAQCKQPFVKKPKTLCPNCGARQFR
jgi:TM2 domain-containing membrane protein YozV